MNQVFLSDSVYVYFGTSSATTGAATNADSTPTVVVAEDGVDLVYSPTVTNVATGLYKVEIAATAGNGFEAGRRYNVYAVATVGTITGRDGVGEFEVLGVDLNTGVASVTGAVGSVTGLTAANLDVAVSTRLAASSYAAPLDASGTRTAIGLASADLDAQLAALPTAAEIVAAQLTTAITEAYRANGTAPTLAQFMSEVLAHLGEMTIVGTTKTINRFDHTTAAETFTLNSATAPTAIQRAT